MRNKERGLGILDCLCVIGIIAIILATAVPEIEYIHDRNVFRNQIGLAAPEEDADQAEIDVIQPLVYKRISELLEDATRACDEAVKLRTQKWNLHVVPTQPTLSDTQNRLEELKKLNGKIADAEEKCRSSRLRSDEVISAVKNLGLKTVNPEP